MKITRYACHPYTAPLNRPIHIGEHEANKRQGHIIELFTKDGAVGRGDVAPLGGLNPEDLSLACEQTAMVGYSLLGSTVSSAIPQFEGAFEKLFSEFDLYPSVRFGVESAILNLLAAVEDMPLSKLLNPDARDTVTISGLITSQGDEAVQRAGFLRDRGFRAVKLKVGGDPKQAAAVARAVRETVGADVTLRLDANCAWSFADALLFTHAIEDLAIDYLEEPLSKPMDTLQLIRKTDVPLALDETLLKLYPDVLPSWKGVKAIVLKPTVLGGIERAMHFAREAREIGVTPVVSAAFESGVGIGTLAHLAAALNGDEDVPAGLDTYGWLDHDVLREPLPAHAPTWDLADVDRALQSFDVQETVDTRG